MDAVGRIGLIVPEINSFLDHEFVNGVYAQAKALGYDVIVYTGIFNSIRELRFDAYIAGLENIYTLLCTQRLDGIIYAAERFHTEPVIEKLFDCLGQTDTPCLVLGREHDGFPSMEADGFSGMYQITRHLIKQHACRKLYCITGIPGHRASLVRLRGFTQACGDAGIRAEDSDIFYGYFWKDIPEKIGREIAENKLDRPDAIVCASDVMAVALIEALTEQGIRVPEDIAVTGYDGGWDSVACKPALTTVEGRDRQFGVDCVCRLYEMIAGKTCGRVDVRQRIRLGESCGCSAGARLQDPLEAYVRDLVEGRIEKHTYIATDMISRISEAASLSELSDRIDEISHVLSGADWVDVCLCQDWQADLHNPHNFRQYGYPDSMYLLLSKRFGDNEKAGYLYPTEEILPALSKPHAPRFVVLTALHCGGQIFGYAALGYPDSRRVHIEEAYVCWCDAISNGLKLLQERLYTEHFNRQLETAGTVDPATGMLNKCGFLLHFPEVAGRYLQEGRRPVLLLLTYFPYKIGAVEPSFLIGDIIVNHCYHRLCARIRERTFAIILPVDPAENEMEAAEELVARIETSLRERFAAEQIPEFVMDLSELAAADASAAEQTLRRGTARLLDRVKAMESNYVDYKEQIYRLRRNIISNPQLEWDVQQVADQVCISRSHLHRLYKQLFSVSIKDDVISARIRKAMQLLSHTDMRVQEVAIQCGYHNENHFMRQFKVKTGVTASSYRKQNR